MLFIAIDKHDVGTYIEAESWEQAESICACNNLVLIGEVNMIIETPGIN